MKNTLYFINLDSEEDNFNKYSIYLDLLSLEKQILVHNFKFDIDKKLSILSDLFVRYVACMDLSLDNCELSFSKSIDGKPYLVGYPNFHYNITHTRNAIAIGFSDKPIGVDIERIKEAKLEVAERFFCKSELDYIISNDKDKDRLFHEIWIKKESYVKWNGKGLSLQLNSFDVTDASISRYLSLFEMNDYIISVCCKDGFHKPDLLLLNGKQAHQVLEKFISLCVL